MLPTCPKNQDHYKKRALKTFCSKLDTHLQKVGTEEYENIRFPIYHYTNLEGIEGILRSGCLWLTSVNDLDDPTEITWVLNLARDKIKREASGTAPLLSFFCKKFLSGIDKAMSKQFGFYSASFCQHGDLAHLWNVFGDEGKGARIGFSSKAFPFLSAEEVNAESLANDFFLYPISYDVDHAHIKQEEATAEAFRVLSRPVIRKKLTDGYQDGIFLKDLSVQLSIWLMFNATKYKLPEYKKESEVRALLVKEQQEISSQIMTMEGTGKKYMEYQFDPPIRQKGIVVDILLGPNTSIDDEKRLLSVLDETDYPNINISRSKLAL